MVLSNLRKLYWNLLGFLINRVTNRCAECVSKDYYRSLKKYGEEISKRYREVSKIFIIGGCNNPGISDIDVLIVLDDYAIIKKPTKLCNIEKYSSYVTHGPFITTNSLFSEFRSYNTYMLEPLYIRNPKDKFLSYDIRISSGNQYYLNIVLISLYVLHFLKNIDLKQKINIRNVRHNLLKLKSICHTASCVFFLHPTEKDKLMLNKFINSVNALRDSWFYNSRGHNKKQLIFLEEKSKKILYKCGEIVNQSLNELITVENLKRFKVNGLIFKDIIGASNEISSSLAGVAKFIAISTGKGKKEWLDIPISIKFKCNSFREYLEDYSKWISKQYDLYNDSNGFYACLANPPYISGFFERPVFSGSKVKMHRRRYIERAIFLTVNRFLIK